MVQAVKSPIYPAGKAHRRAFYHIQVYIDKEVKKEGMIAVSQVVAEAVAPKSWSSNNTAHNINQIRWDGIAYRDIEAHEDKNLALPGINYFGPTNGTTHRLLLLPQQLVELGKYFGIPPAVLKDANFVYDPSQRFRPSEAWLRPRWRELIDPILITEPRWSPVTA